VAAACDRSTQAPQAPRYRGDMVDERMPGSDQSGSLDERRTEAARPVPGPAVSVLTPISGYTTRPGGHSRHVEPSAGPDSDTLARPPPRAFRTPSKGAGHEGNF
jgi:hypothetical protein